MEATSQFPSTATITFDNMATSPQFLNPEDLHSTASSSPAYEAGDGQHSSMTQASPAPVIVHSKPAKKRKSWGQALPEPKTMLPPRKRAKTDDEKEQRRIERIKRNRAAAHNSRERKRQETETLAVALARANAELNAYRSLHGPLPSHIVLPEVTLDNGETPTPSLVEDEAAPSPASPPEDDIIKQEPLDTTFPLFPTPAFENLDAKATLSLDQTQHSAVSIEGSSSGEPSFNNIDFSTFANLVGGALPPPHDTPTPDLLPSYDAGNLEPFAFADGALDASFGPPLDFSFDDFIHHDGSATAAVDGHGAL